MSEIKCCLGAHIEGYGHSRNCRGGLVNWADEFSDIKKEIEKLRAELEMTKKLRTSDCNYINQLTKQNEIMKKALEDISILDPYPDTEKNIRRSHDRHIKIAKLALQESEGVEKITITGAIIHGAGYVETKPVKIEHGSPPQGKITIEED